MYERERAEETRMKGGRGGEEREGRGGGGGVDNGAMIQLNNRVTLCHRALRIANAAAISPERAAASPMHLQTITQRYATTERIKLDLPLLRGSVLPAALAYGGPGQLGSDVPSSRQRLRKQNTD